MRRRILTKQIIFTVLFSVPFWIIDGLYGTWFCFIVTSATVLLWFSSIVGEFVDIGDLSSEALSCSFIRWSHILYALDHLSNKISE